MGRFAGMSKMHMFDVKSIHIQCLQHGGGLRDVQNRHVGCCPLQRLILGLLAFPEYFGHFEFFQFVASDLL